MKPKIKHLLKLADYLENLPKGKDKKSFGMSKWSCETSACAIGHAIEAGISPKGLRLEYEAFSKDSSLLPIFHGHRSYRAIALAYQMDIGIAFDLFFPYSYKKSKKNPKKVAKRIREYCESVK